MNMVRKITALKVRKNLGQLLEEVYYKGDQYVIERAGRPMAAVVPVWQLKEWQERRARANVLVSAVLNPAGVPGQIFDEWRAERFALLASAPILEEIARVLEYPRIARGHRWPHAKVREFVAELGHIAMVTPGEITLNVVRNDPDDNRYLECVVEGAADYLVLGDQDLLALIGHGACVVRPAQIG
jgi:hypothetical protein